MKWPAPTLHGSRTHADKTIQLQTIRINQRIRAKEVRVVLASTSEQLGVMKLQDALRKAMELGLDLVEVSANAVPPVCRIVDFGKFKYELSKHEKEKKSNAASKMKEVKFRVNIGTHDYETKLRHAEEFLDKGNKVRMLLQFRGREMAHQELGMGLMGKIRKNLESMGHPEAEPKLIGRNIFMTLVPLPPGKRKRHFYGPHDMTLQEPDEIDEADEDVEEPKPGKK